MEPTAPLKKDYIADDRTPVICEEEPFAAQNIFKHFSTIPYIADDRTPVICDEEPPAAQNIFNLVSTTSWIGTCSTSKQVPEDGTSDQERGSSADLNTDFCVSLKGDICVGVVWYEIKNLTHDFVSYIPDVKWY